MPPWALAPRRRRACSPAGNNPAGASRTSPTDPAPQDSGAGFALEPNLQVGTPMLRVSLAAFALLAALPATAQDHCGRPAVVSEPGRIQADQGCPMASTDATKAMATGSSAEQPPGTGTSADRWVVSLPDVRDGQTQHRLVAGDSKSTPSHDRAFKKAVFVWIIADDIKTRGRIRMHPAGFDRRQGHGPCVARPCKRDGETLGQPAT
jgi:hypothetical protein